MTQDERIAAVARALAHPARVDIVRLLAAQSECKGAEVFSELPLAQSTISEHLRVLREAGLVGSRPVGTSKVYCLVPEVLDGFGDSVKEIVATCATCGAGTEGR